ncbi:MAG: cytochrome c family protein [Planctomycetes bacterium]|nr:cytochrome c family protein [Planctomycetota bacterium]
MKLALISLVCLTALVLSGASVGTDGSNSLAAAPQLGDSDCARLEDAEFTGSDSCKKCHFKQHMSWKKTEMASAFETLLPGKKEEAKKKAGLDVSKDYSQDASCLPCHTTGYGKKGGYPALVAGKAWTEEETKRAKEMQGVQCESCHGPGSLANVHKKDHEDYKQAEIFAMGMHAPDAANCKTCHNEKSPTLVKDQPFDYEKLTKDEKQVHKRVPLKHQH